MVLESFSNRNDSMILFYGSTKDKPGTEVLDAFNSYSTIHGSIHQWEAR